MRGNSACLRASVFAQPLCVPFLLLGETMARKRMIAPCIWEDEKFNKLSLIGRLLFIGLISNADDYGKLKGHPAVVKGKVFPFDDYNKGEIEKELATLNDVDLITWWRDKDNYYIKVKNFSKYQVQQKDRMQDSQIPEPTNDKQMISKCVADDKQVTTQVKLSKDKTSKDKISEDNLSVSKKPLTEMQQVVESYKLIKGFTNVPQWDKHNFKSCIRPANALLDMAGGKVDVVVDSMTGLGKHFDEEGLSWSLHAIQRNFADWQKGKFKGKKSGLDISAEEIAELEKGAK